MLFDIILKDVKNVTDYKYIIAQDTFIEEVVQYDNCLGVSVSKNISGEKIVYEIDIPYSLLSGKEIIIKAKNE